MTLKTRLTDDMKAAMKGGDKASLGVIRLVNAAIKQREVDERVELDDAQVLAVLEKMVKQRKDSVTQYVAAGRGSRPRRSVQALALGHVARGAAGLALHRGGGLALALLRRLLVELALAGLGEDAGLFAGALEAAEGKLERLVFADFDAGHTVSRVTDMTRTGRASRV